MDFPKCFFSSHRPRALGLTRGLVGCQSNVAGVCFVYMTPVQDNGSLGSEVKQYYFRSIKYFHSANSITLAPKFSFVELKFSIFFVKSIDYNLMRCSSFPKYILGSSMMH